MIEFFYFLSTAIVILIVIVIRIYWDRELLRLEGASIGCAGCRNSQPTRPSDET